MLTPHPIVSKFEMFQTGAACLGSADYGYAANGVLRHNTQLLGRGHVWTEQGDVSVHLVNEPYGQPMDSPAPDPEAIAAKVHELQPDLPYMLKIVRVPADGPGRSNPEKGIRIFTIDQGEISRTGLRVFLETRQYAQHTLSGALGKAIDTLCIVGGVVAAEDLPSRDYQDIFISRTSFVDDLRQSALSKAECETALTTIAEQTHAQLHDVRQSDKTDKGELVFEGRVDIGAGNRLRFEQIAQTSLGEVLPHRFGPNSPVAEYLYQTYGR